VGAQLPDTCVSDCPGILRRKKINGYWKKTAVPNAFFVEETGKSTRNTLSFRVYSENNFANTDKKMDNLHKTQKNNCKQYQYTSNFSHVRIFL
jgi:hypothetical protein